MLNFGSRSFYGAAAFTGLVATLYTLGTSDYSGKILLWLAVVALVGLGSAAVAATGSAERFSDIQASLASANDQRPSIAPFASALGLGVLGLSVALGMPAFVAGLIVLLVGSLLWFIASWRSHPEHVARIADRVSSRFSLPFGMPLAMLGLIIGIAYAVSRSLLAASKVGSIWVMSITALSIFVGGFIAASRPSKKGLMQALAVTAVVSAIVMFTVGQVAHERKTEEPGKSEPTEQTKESVKE
jgi:hypothetical protein